MLIRENWTNIDICRLRDTGLNRPPGIIHFKRNLIVCLAMYELLTWIAKLQLHTTGPLQALKSNNIARIRRLHCPL